MNILVVTLSPIGALTSSMFRVLAVTKGLMEQGHCVDFITVPMNALQSENKLEEWTKDLNIIEINSGQSVNAVLNLKNEKTFISKMKNGMRNILRKIWHTFVIYDNSLINAYKIQIKLLPKKEYDLILSSSDPKTSHIAVKNLIRQGLKYKRWIQYWGDPLTADITNRSIYPRWILKKVEKKLIKGADKIIYVSPFTLDIQKRLFKQYENKMCFIPTPYMKKEIFEKTSNEKYTVGYFGAYTSRVRNIIPFYEAIKEMNDEIHAVIMGDSDLKLESTPEIEIYQRGIKTIYERKSDLIVCLLNNRGSQIPGKIYHAAGTNKPILVIVDGDDKQDMISFLNSYNRYYVCENEKNKIMDAIRTIRNEKREFSPLPEFDYASVAKEIIK